MTEQLHGHLVAVNREYLGDEVAVDSGSDGSLVVGDGADFDESGGWVSIDGTLYEYDTVTDTTLADFDEPVILNLVSPPVSDVTAGTPVDVWSLDDNAAVVEWVGQVLLDGQDEGDPVEAVIDHALVPLLPETIHPDGGNAVTLRWDEDELVIASVNGKIPSASGAYLDPTTIPVFVPTVAPAASPDLTTYGLPSSIVLNAASGVVDPGAEIEYHASLTSGFTPDTSTLLPDTPTASLVYVVKNMPDGSAVPLSTEVYFRAVAVNDVGSAAASAEVEGATDPEAVGVIAAETVAAETGIIGRIFTDRVEFGTGYLDADEGLVLPQPGGSATRLTNDGVTPSQIAGYVIIDGGTISDNLNAYGLTQMFGTFRLANGISDPAVPADLSRTWDSLDTDLTTSEYPDIHYGLVENLTDSDEWITVSQFFGGGRFRSVDKTTGALNPFIFGSIAPLLGFGGVTTVGSNYYVLGTSYEDGKWYVYKYNSSFVEQDSFLVSDSFANKAAIGTDGTDLLVSWVTSTGALRLRVYTTAGSLSSDDTLLAAGSIAANRAIGGVYRGSADFGATRTVIVAMNGDSYVFNSGLSRVTADEFQRAGGAACRGLTWDGTRFVSIDGSARLWNYHTGHTQDGTIYGGYTWYDADTSSGSSTHETKVSPAESFTWPARSKLVVTGKPAPEAGVVDPTKLDKANLVRIYVGTSSAAMRLQDGGGTDGALPLGETELELESPNTGSAVAPTSSNFSGAAVTPGSFESAAVADLDGEPLTQLLGDASGRFLKIQQAGVTSSGTLTAGTTAIKTVTFPEPFDTTPVVQLTCESSSGAADNYHAYVRSRSTTGFEYGVLRASGTTAIDVLWTATVPT